MPRRPCMVCRTTVSTPVKFLLQCSCGIGLHHTCIVPAMPKEVLLLMVKASTDGCHANSLDNWHCPGCKATENVKKTAPTIKKHVQPHPVKRLDLASPARARIDDKMRKDMQALPIPVRPPSPVNKPPKDSTPVKKRFKQSRHPSAQLENKKETARPLLARNPKPLPTNAPRQLSLPPKNRDPSSERVVPANADIRLMVQPSSSKVLLVNNNDILQAGLSSNPPVKVGQVLPKIITKPSQITLPVVPHIPPKPFPTTARDNETTTVLPSKNKNKDQEFAPLPPLLDLRRLLKRKRLHMPKAFQPNLHVSPVEGDDETDESPAKRRRLNRDCHPALREAGLVVESSSDSLHVKDVNQLIQVQASTTPLRDMSSGPLPDLIVHELDKPPKDNNNIVQEDTQIQGARSDSESRSSIAIAVNEARLIEDSPLPMTDIEVATTHSEGRGSSHTDAPATFSKEASPTRDNELAMADILEPVALYPDSALSALPPPPHTEQDTSDNSSLERSEVDKSLDDAIADNNSQDESVPISNGDFFGVGAKAPQETSFTDGLYSPPPFDDDVNDSNHQPRDKDVTEEPAESNQHELDPATTGISDFADQMCKDKVSIAALPSHSENSSAEEEEKEVLTQLDAIVQRLPQLQPRRSYKLPKMTLPVLATCFGSFKATSKRVGVGL